MGYMAWPQQGGGGNQTGTGREGGARTCLGPRFWRDGKVLKGRVVGQTQPSGWVNTLLGRRWSGQAAGGLKYVGSQHERGLVISHVT